MDNDRWLSCEEKRWIRRLHRCLDDMPEGLEIMVCYDGLVYFMNAGTIEYHFREFGNLDNVPHLEVITPTTAKRIDGRDTII